MDNVDGIKLGHTIFREIDSNPYLHELYESILYNYSVRLLGPNSDSYKSIDIEDALRFADILSKSNDPVNSDRHKIMAQEIVALLKNIHPENPTIDFYLGSVLSNTGNYRGMTLVAPNHQHGTLMDQFYTEFSKDYMRIPAAPESQFFRSQKAVYDHLNDSYFSYSGPTSMGKSFIMRMFIKEQVTEGIKANYALIVPTKALINEVSSSIINDLKEMLAEYNYKIVTSAGALALKEEHNFILVMTPERMLYLMISNPSIEIEYLFVDEAHKISSNDSRSPFYYKVVDMLSRREKKPKMIFASPNIPNPEIYLDLIPSSYALSEQKFRSTFTPVSQMKFLIDFPEKDIKLFNNYTGDFVDFMPLNDTITFNQLISYIGKESQNIVYCHSTNKAVELALEFAKTKSRSNDKELLDLSRDITNEVHGDYYLADIICKGVAYHIGYLPSTIRMRIEELYRKGLIQTIFSTSTLVEAVNLPADNLFITHYKVGRSKMPIVDFKNLVGRVGRIEYNLFGNVFLVRLEEKTKPKEFMDLIMNDVPEQSLSLASQLSNSIKQQIVDSLLEGSIEFHKQSGQNYNQYALMRKFAIILLRDITKGNDSFVRSQFQPFLNERIESIIIEKFSTKTERIDDDINISADQVDNLTSAIAKGLTYPELNEHGNIDYNDLMSFLEKLCKIFKWEIYEKQTLGHVSKQGNHGLLRWYAVILSQWIKGTGLSFIIKEALEFKRQNPETCVWDNWKPVRYDDSLRHRNLVISDTLQVIENVILFSISNYFLRFSSEYKRFHNVESFLNDWYEYVEYGTTNPLSITLQRNGFSRETSTYIKRHRDQYVITTEVGEIKLLNIPEQIEP
ncbi:MAG TPA: helicase, partial [Clostridiales bacterium]|nr:helicase [Clostridiales bacterium]